MTIYRVSDVADLLGVSQDTVRRWTDSGRLPARREGGERLIEGADLAHLLTETAPPGDESPVLESARNRFPGIVTRVIKDKVAAQVEVQAGPHRIVSLLTREAVDDLGLEPGMLAVAVVKATNVVIELPPES